MEHFEALGSIINTTVKKEKSLAFITSAKILCKVTQYIDRF
jgi:hypothetical protein